MNILERDRRRNRIIDIVGWSAVFCGLAAATVLLIGSVMITRPCKAADPGFFIGGVVMFAGCSGGAKR